MIGQSHQEIRKGVTISAISKTCNGTPETNFMMLLTLVKNSKAYLTRQFFLHEEYVLFRDIIVFV